MKAKRVLIVNTQSLLMGAAENLLRNNGGIVLINTNTSDMLALISEIEKVQPNVIVMDEDTYFIEPLRLFTFLWNVPNIRLIVLSGRINLVNVYEKHDLAISSPSQLIDAIEFETKVFNAG